MKYFSVFWAGVSAAYLAYNLVIGDYFWAPVWLVCGIIHVYMIGKWGLEEANWAALEHLRDKLEERDGKENRGDR